MKKTLTYYVTGLLICLMSAMVGCSEEDIPTPVQGGKEEGEIVDINVSVRTEEYTGITKADIDKGADGEDEAFWARYDMRYILEVWKNISNTSVVVYRDTITKDNFVSADFNVKLINGNTYDILFWADVVNQGSKDDLNYQTISTNDGFGLKSVYREVYKANDNSCDAFTGASRNITINNSSAKRSITLSRPVAKLITSGTIGNDLDVDSVAIFYPSINRTYNAYTSEYMDEGNVSYQIGQRVTSKEYSIFDYIFVPKDIRDGATPILKDTTINYSVIFYKDNKQVAIKEIKKIPIGANKKTKVAVNGYTPKTIYKEGDLYTSPDRKITGVVYKLDETDPAEQKFDLVYPKFWKGVTYFTAIQNITSICSSTGIQWEMPTKEDLLALASSITINNLSEFRNNILCDNPSGDATYDIFAAISGPNLVWSGYWSLKDNSSNLSHIIWLLGTNPTEDYANYLIDTNRTQDAYALAVHKGIRN